MTKLRAVLCPNATRLLERAADWFLHPRPAATGPCPSAPYLLALRQGGLRDDLYDLAARRGVSGWFDPPLCVFRELPAWLGTTARRPLNDFERAALLAQVLREHGGPVFRARESHFLGSVEQLFGELRAEAVTPRAFASAMSRLQDREDYQRERDAALVRLYDEYVGRLEQLGVRDGRDDLADAAEALHRAPDELARRLAGRREVRIVGLADLRGGWRPLLRALTVSPAVDCVAVYAAGLAGWPPELAAGLTTEEIREGDGERGPDLHVLAAPDAESELAAVVSRVRQLVETGTPTHRIAIVARDARPYTDLALDALDAAGLPGSARRRVACVEIPVVRALLALLDAAAGRWTRSALAEIGAQPYLAAEVDARIINFLGYRRRIEGLQAWRAELAALVDEARAAEARTDDDEPRAFVPPSAWVARAQERFDRFAAVAAALDGERSLLEWLEWLSAFVRDDPWRIAARAAAVPFERWDVVRLDQLGWRGLRDIVAEWLAAERAWPEPPVRLDAAAFVRRVRAMLAGDVAVWTPAARGVRVLEAPAASHRAFDHVFLVGMNAGQFPRRAPSSLLLGERDREALRAAGLPLDIPADWEAREAALFRTLTAGATASLTMSYVAVDDAGAAAIPSAFLDALVSPGEAVPVETGPAPVRATPEAAARGHRAAMIERERATGLPSPWNGRIEDPGLRAWLTQSFGDDRVWSPTRIEAYAKCPWAFFSNHLLRLIEPQDPDADVDKRVVGAVMHDALRRFYDAAARRVGAPVAVRSEDAPWARALLRASLADALDAAERTAWLGHALLRDVRRAELERDLWRFLEFEMEENRKALDGRTAAGRSVRTAVTEHELRFDGVKLERGGISFRFRGIMDRVEVGADERAPGRWLATVDYKRSLWSCPGGESATAWDDGVVLQVPLYAYALSTLRPGWSVARVEYRAILQARRVHALYLARVGKGGVSQNQEDRDRMERALDAVAGHVRRIRSGDFPAAPAPSCRCPPFCHGWDICRVRGGPSTGRD